MNNNRYKVNRIEGDEDAIMVTSGGNWPGQYNEVKKYWPINIPQSLRSSAVLKDKRGNYKTTTRRLPMVKTGKILIIIVFLLATITLYAQKDTRYDSGLNLPFNEKAGDVNPQIGNITLSFTDVELPGRAGMNFQFGRIWALNQSHAFTMYCNPVDGSNQLNSRTVEQVNHMGVGWSSTLPYIMQDDSSGELVLNLFFGGSVYELDQSGIEIFNPSKSNILGYDLLDMRVYKDSSIGYGDFERYDLNELRTEYSLVDTIGNRSVYMLILKDNSRLWFRQDGRIMMQQDRTGLNRIWYFYGGSGQLRLVVDTLGRKISFVYNENDYLSEVSWTVEQGTKAKNGKRSYVKEVRNIKYTYKSASNFPKTKLFLDRGYVNDPEVPYVLETVTDPQGNVSHFTWQEGSTLFTYDSRKAHAENIQLLLTSMASVYSTDSSGNAQYKSMRCFEYNLEPTDTYRKYFYNGFMEFYRIARQYYKNRHGAIMNDTHYIYHGNNENGNAGVYTTVIELGQIRTIYTYSLSNEKSKTDVLAQVTVETSDGFKQETDYVYDNERKKTLEEVYRQGSLIYREKFLFDARGNLKRHEDKAGLVTVTEYDELFSIPLHIFRTLKESDQEKTYELETVINKQGQVLRNNLLLEQAEGSKRSVSVEAFTYDSYGNVIAKTDALGNIVHTVYDEASHAFPVKTYTDVEIDAWSASGTVHDNWQLEPDRKKPVRIRSWKLFNTDGRAWVEIDNEGYAIEHYYDKNGIEIEVVNPDSNDLRDFAQPVELINGQPAGSDFDDFRNYTGLDNFLASRLDNPGARMEVDYQHEFVKTFTDINAAQHTMKVTGVQKDGLGNTEEETEYGAGGQVYAVKRMEYDSLGRMLALTDPDAGTAYKTVRVNGTDIRRFDKTWIIKYDDLGRKLLVLYPETVSGKTDTKTLAYNDKENSVTTIDPEGRRLYERRDWNGNLVEVVAFGDSRTLSTEVQHYMYTYDQLKRKTSFTDPEGIVTRYFYDERNLLIEQAYGQATGSDYMSYDDRGLLIKKTDRKGNVIAFTYDALGRNTCAYHYKSADDYAKNILDHKVALSYDNRGNAVRICNQNLVEHYIYDFANRVITLERKLKDAALRRQLSAIWGGDATTQIFTFRYTYNDAGMVTEMVYPDGAAHKFSYDSYLGRLQELDEGSSETNATPFVKSLTYNKAGIVTRMDYANNTYQNWDFDNRQRINRIRIMSPGQSQSVIEDLNYTLNGTGDILRINDNEYQYDGFDRIIGAKTLIPGNVDLKKLVMKYFGTYKNGGQVNGESYNPTADIFPAGAPDAQVNGEDYLYAVLTASGSTYDLEGFEYDRNGNRTRLVQNGDEYSPEYGICNRLERIWCKKKDSSQRKLFAEYAYDANGNTVKRIIYGEEGTKTVLFDYDTMNRLVKTTDEKGQISAYFYDNAGNRFIKQTPEGTTMYLRHGQIAVAMDIELNNKSDSTINRYVLSGDLLAGRVTKTIKTDGTNTVSKYWYHLDHLNSTKCVTKADGTLDVRYEYRAFGEELKKLGDGNAKYTYGGKELDSGTNLYYFNARYYDATTGRFINVDPVQDGSNWYVYCHNNPMNAKDPTGLQEVSRTKPIEIYKDLSYSYNLTDLMRYSSDNSKSSGSFRNILDWLSTGLGLFGKMSALALVMDIATKSPFPAEKQFESLVDYDLSQREYYRNDIVNQTYRLTYEIVGEMQNTTTRDPDTLEITREKNVIYHTEYFIQNINDNSRVNVTNLYNSMTEKEKDHFFGAEKSADYWKEQASYVNELLNKAVNDANKNKATLSESKE